jgi:hypothetical protein
MEKEQFKAEKISSEKRLEEIIREFNDKLVKEKALLIESVENEIKNLNQLVKLKTLFILSSKFLLKSN